jgi:hypothetical protein
LSFSPPEAEHAKEFLLRVVTAIFSSARVVSEAPSPNTPYPNSWTVDVDLTAKALKAHYVPDAPLGVLSSCSGDLCDKYTGADVSGVLTVHPPGSSAIKKRFGKLLKPLGAVREAEAIGPWDHPADFPFEDALMADGSFETAMAEFAKEVLGPARYFLEIEPRLDALRLAISADLRKRRLMGTYDSLRF